MSESNINADDIPLAIGARMKWLVNNQRFADATFVVGEGKKLVYAHKNILATGSPVFERMFFSNHDLQMSGREPIEIPDLTAAGFINMLKYIYTNRLKGLDLSELFDTFMAGNKYQVYKMNDKLFSFVNDVLNSSNCCIIYDQLMKLPAESVCVPVDHVKELIRYNSASALKNEQFMNVSLETVLDILNMDTLTVDEIDVLASCADWVAAEIKRQNLEPNAANMQETFKPIKNFIRFSMITIDQLKNFKPIMYLLSSDELNSLFAHYLDLSILTFGCSTARTRPALQSATCGKSQPGNFNYNRSTFLSFDTPEFITIFKASSDIFITNVYTFLSTVVQDVKLSISDNVSELELELNCEKLSTPEDNCWYFRFIDFVKIDATKEYKFLIKFDTNMLTSNSLSRNTAMIVQQPSALQIILSGFTHTNGYHCLKKIDFYEMS
ncbi:hypothetical protein HA402_002690 [Bradysia odoriphaga]|nr:hypothetical protein HA402_002690 [Bradysia odoriphaga]